MRVAIVLFVLAITASAQAQAFDDPGHVRFDLTAGTTFPLHLGAQGVLELPYRIQIAAEIGWMPPAYLDAINAVSTSAGWYSTTDASLISAALDNALVARLAVGWRPFPSEGFEVRAGYTGAFLGGGLSGADAIQAATGRDVSGSGREIPLQATAHGFHVSLGWAWTIERVVVIRVELAYYQMVYTHTWIATQGSNARQEQVLTDASHALDTYLNGLLTTYVKTPTLSLWVGYRFE